MTRTPAQRLAARVCAVLVGLALATIAAFALTRDYRLARELWLIRATGWSAFAALFLALAMTPLSQTLAHRVRVRPSTWLAFRRSFGISSASLALVHLGLTLSTYLNGSWPSVLTRPYLRAGLVAVTILTALLITSFPEIVATLRLKHWKQLHRLAYVAAFFVFQHLLMSPLASRRWALAALVLLLLVEALRLWPAGKKKPLP